MKKQSLILIIILLGVAIIAYFAINTGGENLEGSFRNVNHSLESSKANSKESTTTVETQMTADSEESPFAEDDRNRWSGIIKTAISLDAGTEGGGNSQEEAARDRVFDDCVENYSEDDCKDFADNHNPNEN